jgi:hypothetical protein
MAMSCDVCIAIDSGVSSGVNIGIVLRDIVAPGVVVDVALNVAAGVGFGTLPDSVGTVATATGLLVEPSRSSRLL